MSSIQSFLRQRNPANSLSKPPANNGCYYTFVAGPGNYVGNYPPGYMVPVSTTVIPATLLGPNYLMRDMGKTIKAPLAVITNEVASLNADAIPGFFREVQIIEAVPAVGAVGSTTFGVGNNLSGNAAGPNAGNAGYGTYYIPTVIDGTLATDGVGGVAQLSSNYHPAGQQM